MRASVVVIAVSLLFVGTQRATARVPKPPKVPRKLHKAIASYVEAVPSKAPEGLAKALELLDGDVALAAEALRTLPPLTKAKAGTKHGIEFESRGRTFTYSIRLPKRYDGKKRFPVLVLPDHGSVGPEAGISFWERHEAVDDYVLFRPVIVKFQEDRSVFPDAQFFAKDQPLAEVMHDALVHLRLNYAVDPERFSMTGLSQAGYYTWYYAASFPDQFAAIAPESAGGIALRASIMKMPQNFSAMRVRVLHTEGDQITPYQDAKGMLAALERVDADVELITYSPKDYGGRPPPKLHPGPHDLRLENVLPWAHTRARTIPEEFERVIRYGQQGFEGRFRVAPPENPQRPFTLECGSQGGKLTANREGVTYYVSPEDVLANKPFVVGRKRVKPNADLELMLRTFKETGDRGRLAAAEIVVTKP